VSAALTLDNIACELDERVLFTKLSAKIGAGDLVQIVGPNGAGKTTLLKIITGIFSNYRGEIRWGEHKVPCYEFYASLLYLGHAIGVKVSLTPMENLLWYFGLNGSKADQSEGDLDRGAYLRALAEVGLAGYEDVPAYQMSAGQQRRIALARLYLSKAPLWILDEPFTAIDKQGVANLEALLIQHRDRGGIAIFTSHQTFIHASPQQIDLADYAKGQL